LRYNIQPKIMYTKSKTIIVDDNPQSVSMLKYLLADFTEEFDLVGEAGTSTKKTCFCPDSMIWMLVFD